MPKSIVRSIGLIASLVLFVHCAAPTAQAQTRNLNIYWIDVEGGAATLIVSPSGESLLVDAGWEVGDRDAKRIFATAQRAGLTRIDYFILSHFHADHAGGLPALAKLIPIAKCFDRGDFIEPANQKWRDGYLSVCGNKRTIVKAGDKIPLKGLQVDIVASDGRLITQPIVSNGGGQPNPLCATAENKPKDVPENQLMVGALLTYGNSRSWISPTSIGKRKWSSRARSTRLARSPSGRRAATERSTALERRAFSTPSGRRS
jgi:hypothetical protein